MKNSRTQPPLSPLVFAILATMGCALAVSAGAAPTVRTDGTVLFQASVPGGSGALSDFGDAGAERAAFGAFTNGGQGKLTGPRLETFESYPLPDNLGVPSLPASLAFGGGSGAGLSTTQTTPPPGEASDDGIVNGAADSPPTGSGFQGRFNTTSSGEKFLRAAYGFTLDFGTQNPFSALGFYGTDFGDFAGTFNLVLTTATGAVLDPIPVAGSGGNGSLLFFGFIDPTGRTYSKAEFRINQSASTVDLFDQLGFDDITVTNWQRSTTPPDDNVPEPGTLALVGLSLLGLAASRRRWR